MDDLSDWKFHGLILRAEGESFYRAAAAGSESNDAPSTTSRRRTLDLFAYLFQKILFVGLPVICAGAACPDEEEEAAAVAYDAGVMTFNATGNSPSMRMLCFADGRDTANTSAADDTLAEALEKRALAGCEGFLAVQPDVQRIYACTLVGARIRCWMLARTGEDGDEDERGNQLVGVWAGDCHGRFSHYLDIGADETRAVIEGALSQMLGDLPIRTSPW